MYKYCTAVCRKYSAGGPVFECFGDWGCSVHEGELPVPSQARQAQASCWREAHSSWPRVPVDALEVDLEPLVTSPDKCHLLGAGALGYVNERNSFLFIGFFFSFFLFFFFKSKLGKTSTQISNSGKRPTRGLFSSCPRPPTPGCSGSPMIPSLPASQSL